MKQNSVLKRNLLKVTSWTLAHASWMTMAFSPVALGAQAEKNSAEFYKQQVHSIGLDKGITAQEFWNNIKNDLPGYAYYEIEKAVKQNPNARMPKFEVKTSKGSDGQTIPVITFAENGKTTTIQMYGEKDKFMKYNNTVISESDSQTPSSLFQKLIDSDPKLNQQYQQGLKSEPKATSAKSSSTKSALFSQMNKDMWKKMSMEQRVSYFIQMRMMYMDAKKVIELHGGKKTASFNQLEMIYKAIFQDAKAGEFDDKIGSSSSKNTYTSLDGKKKISIPFDAQSCIVAGYVGKYVPMISNANGSKRPGCSVDVAIATYQKKSGLEYVNTANTQCVSSQGSQGVACNPIIYGYPKGNPICVNKNAQDFQIATHWEGPCDVASRLSYSKNVVDTQGKDYSKIAPESAQIEAIKKDQAAQDFALTKAFIEGVLTKKDSSLLSLFKDGKWSQGLEDEIKRMGSQFDTEIKEAIQICEKDITAKHEKNQKGACDQLHRRKLFVEEVLAQLKKDVPVAPVVATTCPEGSTLVVTEDKAAAPMCECKPPYDADNKDRTISFEATKPLPAACAKKDEPKPEPKVACDQYPPLKVGSELNTDCSCKNKAGEGGNIPKEDQPGLFRKLFNSKANRQFKKPKTEDGTRVSNKSTNNDQEREYSCKFGPNWWLIGGGALAIGGVVALLLHKKKPKVITNTVTNTVIKTVTVTDTIDNTVTCTAPKYPVIVSTTAENKPVYECVCKPCGKYYLQNGTSVEITPNPLTCACEGPPTEGGGGDNPNDGGGSGGVPGQH